MQITETVSEGLRREFKVVIAQTDLDTRLNGRIEEIKPKMNLKGFRPGKAPVSYLKKTFGKSMMGEIVEAAVNESSQQAIKDNSLKPASQPQVDLVSEMEKVIDGKSDLEFTVKVDLMPDFELTDVAKLKIEKLVADVTDADVDEALKRLADQAKSYAAAPAGTAAESGDLVVINFVGKVDGTEFPGGKADDFNLTLGTNQLIPGFEDQLIGSKQDEERAVKVTFPADYPEASLAGKDAVFDVTVKEVRKPDAFVMDNEFAKKFGMDDVATLKERVREQIKSDFANASRLHLKRRVLDALDGTHSFPLPPGMVEAEFNGIWRQVEAELKRENKTFADEGKTEDELKAEYRKIAERRVRLGLVLARLGEQNGITVAPEEVSRAISARARQFPGQEQQVFQFYSQNPQAAAEIRAPIFEDKVVDFIAELADVTEKKVDRETLFMDPDDAEAKLGA